MKTLYRKKLTKLLEIAPQEPFIQMIWAADAIQSDNPQAGLKFLNNVHVDSITNKISNPRFVHKWELETITNEMIAIAPRIKPLKGKNRVLDCKNYSTVLNLINVLRKLENSEAGARLRNVDVYSEMQRISLRQFDWQRGWLNHPQIYRSIYLYGQGAASDFFQQKYGISVSDFLLSGLLLYSHFLISPNAKLKGDFGPLPIDQAKFDISVAKLSLPMGELRQYARFVRRRQWPTAHQPSVLRRYPCVSHGPNNDELRSPLPPLILERVTSGIFYDLAEARGDVREEYGKRFETYALEHLQTSLPAIDWVNEHAYRSRGGEFKSPDILWLDQSNVHLAIECKATRMSIDARYSDDPWSARGYDEIVKAVYQIWRYFSHCRRGICDKNLTKGVSGLVLTLDSWLIMAGNLVNEVMERASIMANEKDKEIIDTDKKPIIFCSISDLENVLATASEISFGSAIEIAVTKQRQTWLLSSSHDEVCPDQSERRSYPFSDQICTLVPWWGLWKENSESQRGELPNQKPQ